MLRERYPDKLKQKWFKKKPNCPEPEDPQHGLTAFHMGGIFMVLCIGIVASFSTLVFEYWYIKNRKRTPKIIQVSAYPEDTLNAINTLHQIATLIVSNEKATVPKSQDSGSASDSNSDSDSEPKAAHGEPPV